MGDGGRIDFLRRVEWRSIWNAVNAFKVGLGVQQSWHDRFGSLQQLKGLRSDFGYNRDRLPKQLKTLASNAVADEEMNAFQRSSPLPGYVSTPVDGIGTGIREDGRMSSITGSMEQSTHYIPYYPWDDTVPDGPEDGSKPREGGFAGLLVDDEPVWLWQDEIDSRITYRDGAAMVDLSYEPVDGSVLDGVTVDETTYVLPGEEVIVRDFAATNHSDEPVSGSFLYYTQANVTDRRQNQMIWNSQLNAVTAADTLHWDDLEGPYQLEIATDAPVTASGVTDDGLDAVLDALDVEQDSETGRYLSGVLQCDLTLAPGETEQLSVFITDGSGDIQVPQELAAADPGERQAAAEDWWDDWRSFLDTGHMEQDDADRYERAAVTLGALYDPVGGRFPASPNLQPMYYPSWIRDGAFAAVAMARAGHPEPAKTFLADYCATVQEDGIDGLRGLVPGTDPDGSFRMCYDRDGDFSGYIEVENDQQPLYVWAVSTVYEETGDEAFLESVWPTVERALDYTVDSITDNGLLRASPDYAEMPADVRQSLWTNAFAHRALTDGAALADVIDRDGDRYREAAETVGEAVTDHFFDAPGDTPMTAISFGGAAAELNSPDAGAVWPAEMDTAYPEAAPERLVDALYDRFDDEDFWTAGATILAASCYRVGRDDAGDAIMAAVDARRTPAGDLVEEYRDDDEPGYAAPLGWAQAGYMLALEEKYRGQDADEQVSPARTP